MGALSSCKQVPRLCILTEQKASYLPLHRRRALVLSWKLLLKTSIYVLNHFVECELRGKTNIPFMAVSQHFISMNIPKVQDRDGDKRHRTPGKCMQMKSLDNCRTSLVTSVNLNVQILSQKCVCVCISRHVHWWTTALIFMAETDNCLQLIIKNRVHKVLYFSVLMKCVWGRTEKECHT